MTAVTLAKLEPSPAKLEPSADACRLLTLPRVLPPAALDMLFGVILFQYLAGPMVSQIVSGILFSPETMLTYCDTSDSEVVCSQEVLSLARTGFAIYTVALPVVVALLLVQNARGIRLGAITKTSRAIMLLHEGYDLIVQYRYYLLLTTYYSPLTTDY